MGSERYIEIKHEALGLLVFIAGKPDGKGLDDTKPIWEKENLTSDFTKSVKMLVSGTA
jgi:hypothetical protein